MIMYLTYYNKIRNIRNEIVKHILNDFAFDLEEQKRIILRARKVKVKIINSKSKKPNSLELRTPIKIGNYVFERKPVLTIKKNNNCGYFLNSLVHEYVHLLSTKLIIIGQDKCYYKSGLMKYEYSSKRFKFNLDSATGDEKVNEIMTDIVAKYIVENYFNGLTYVIKDVDTSGENYKKYENNAFKIVFGLQKTI